MEHDFPAAADSSKSNLLHSEARHVQPRARPRISDDVLLFFGLTLSCTRVFSRFDLLESPGKSYDALLCRALRRSSTAKRDTLKLIKARSDTKIVMPTIKIIFSAHHQLQIALVF